MSWRLCRASLVLIFLIQQKSKSVILTYYGMCHGSCNLPACPSSPSPFGERPHTMSGITFSRTNPGAVYFCSSVMLPLLLLRCPSRIMIMRLEIYGFEGSRSIWPDPWLGLQHLVPAPCPPTQVIQETPLRFLQFSNHSTIASMDVDLRGTEGWEFAMIGSCTNLSRMDH